MAVLIQAIRHQSGHGKPIPHRCRIPDSGEILTVFENRPLQAPFRPDLRFLDTSHAENLRNKILRHGKFQPHTNPEPSGDLDL